jgi:assimilatory nitrate reductase catalytic subunit
MTGNIGKPGTGANSITGQCNAMGSRLFSNTTNLIGGHDFRNAEHRQKVAAALEVPFERIPDRPSLAYDAIVEAIDAGKIKALWIIATNPSHSWINQDRFNQILSKLDFLVVQDMYHTTETARRAHLVLPAAAWGEKEGTFINSERRIGLNQKVRRAPGQALSDFRIFRLIAHAWGCADMFKKWTSPAEVFQLLKRATEDQPCDISGIENHAMIEAAGGIQWPLPRRDAAQALEVQNRERRLFADGKFCTPDQRARFIFEAPVPPPDRCTADFPFILITGRGTSAQWHTESRTGKSKVLAKLAPKELSIDMHPGDARALGLKDGAKVVVTSPRSALTVRLRHSLCVLPGQVFLPMHDPRVNRLTRASFDPYSHQPSYKHSAVRVTAADSDGRR